MATKCRHQISFSRESEETDQQGTTQCGLCQGHHAHTPSEPRTSPSWPAVLLEGEEDQAGEFEGQVEERV